MIGGEGRGPEAATADGAPAWEDREVHLKEPAVSAFVSARRGGQNLFPAGQAQPCRPAVHQTSMGILGVMEGPGGRKNACSALWGRLARRGLATALAGAFIALMAFGRASADVCVADMWNNGDIGPALVFPNWTRFWAASFDVWVCNGCAWVGTENITGLTVVNFGTLPAGDIGKIYWVGHCGATTTGTQTMTYAGTYAEDSGSYPAWTWNGTAVNFAGCPDLCGSPACGAYFTVDLYVDIAPCPSRFMTLSLGFPVNYANNPLYPGSIYDNAACAVPWGDTVGPTHTAVWAYKQGPDFAAPGDTVDYTITFGRPGSTNLAAGVTITDTQPSFTHYVADSAVPPPDAGWDPNIGPPPKLRWTFPGPLAVAGGPTGKVTFSLSVDWGNGDTFESGSGDVAAPEKARLDNRAAICWPDTSCGTRTVVTPPVTTVVRRFLFWKMADNDMLFAPNYGTPPDEIIYSIFVRNMSDGKTWWDVHIWDTVPDRINAWCVNCGLEDPCVGWTMTPSGCAYAGAGQYVSGGKTILTWKLDMLPKATLSLRWKGQVVPTASSGDTAINTMSLREYGHSRIVDGTGNSGRTVNFTHLAPIMLQTSYVSYVGFAGSVQDAGCPGFRIVFFPLNRKTQFELRGLEYAGTGIAVNGGVSASIGSPVGNCIGGFPGGALPGGGQAGCKSERIPAYYAPDAWMGTCPAFPFDFIYKLASNSPVLWQLLTDINSDQEDNQTFAPATTLSFSGLMHYMWKRKSSSVTAGYGDSLALINTGLDAYGNYDAGLLTTVHMFFFNYGTLDWDYERSYELDRESLAYDMGTPAADVGAWRTASSDAMLVVNHGVNLSDALGCCCGACANDNGAAMPTRETGNTVTRIGSGASYGLIMGNAVGVQPDTRKASLLVVGNTGILDAKFAIERYTPANMLAMPPMPAYLNGASGEWVLMTVDTVPAGLNTPGNPRVYNRDGAYFQVNSLGAYRVRVLSGGPIQSIGGIGVYSAHSGGSIIQAYNGDQVGREFWLHHTGTPDSKTTVSTQVVNVFCPKAGMVVHAASEDGYSATHTTTGPDQCVAFGDITTLANGADRNYRFNIVANANAADATAQFIQSWYTEKGYTAPFLQTGVHYIIIMPPVVYAGQSFWITVVVADVGGVTKTDYAGTTSFTSTDPAAKIQGVGMDGYNYTWSAGTDKGVRIFVNVSFQLLGIQTIVAIDTLDGSITGVGSTMVVGADIKLEKRKKLAVAASGDTVQFQICWSNYSSATGFSFTITDAVPMGTTYVPEIASNMLCGTGAPVPGITVWFSTATTTTPPGTFTSLPGTGSPLANTRWLRWTIRDAYVNSTGCVCFRVSVN